MNAILEVRNLVVECGAIRAVKGISFSVEKGSIMAILGANGAGKSATLKTISGIVRPRSGEIIFEGKNIAGRKVYSIARSGISHSPEGRLVLPGLGVEENLKVGSFSLAKKFRDKGAKSAAENLDYVYSMFPVLKERRKQQANTLSGGEQQMLAIGRALMSSPKMLIMDEPSLGLAPIIVKNIFRCIKEISIAGTTVLIVEQNALQTLKIADYAIVLELGKISIEGKANELIHDQRLIDAYLGNKKQG